MDPAGDAVIPRHWALSRPRVRMCAGGQLADAVGVCAREMGDPQLALFLGRIMESPEQPLVRQIVHKELLPGQSPRESEMGTGDAGCITGA